MIAHVNTLNRTYLWLLIVAGLVEGTSTILLFFVAMPLKYMAGMPEAVTLVGTIHGFLFIGYVAMFIIGRWVVPLSWGMVGLGFVAAVVPFGPFLIDVKLYRMLPESREPVGTG